MKTYDEVVDKLAKDGLTDYLNGVSWITFNIGEIPFIYDMNSDDVYFDINSKYQKLKMENMNGKR